MPEVIKETVVTRDGSTSMANTSTEVKTTSSQTVANLIYFFFGLLETLLAFRLILKLMGANPISGFVRFIYSLTQLFVFPFEGIFRRAVTQGIETVAVLEPATVVALIVYAFLAWGIVKLLQVLSREPETV